MQSIPERLLEADWDHSEPANGEALAVVKFGNFSFATGAGAETNTLSDPFRAGVEIFLNCYSHGGGNRVITAATAINQAGNTIMTFAHARDNIKLRSIRLTASTFAWQVVHNDGVALS